MDYTTVALWGRTVEDLRACDCYRIVDILQPGEPLPTRVDAETGKAEPHVCYQAMHDSCRRWFSEREDIWELARLVVAGRAGGDLPRGNIGVTLLPGLVANVWVDFTAAGETWRIPLDCWPFTIRDSQSELYMVLRQWVEERCHTKRDERKGRKIAEAVEASPAWTHAVEAFARRITSIEADADTGRTGIRGVKVSLDDAARMLASYHLPANPSMARYMFVKALGRVEELLALAGVAENDETYRAFVTELRDALGVESFPRRGILLTSFHVRTPLFWEAELHEGVDEATDQLFADLHPYDNGNVLWQVSNLGGWSGPMGEDLREQVDEAVQQHVLFGAATIRKIVAVESAPIDRGGRPANEELQIRIDAYLMNPSSKAKLELYDFYTQQKRKEKGKPLTDGELERLKRNVDAYISRRKSQGEN